MTETSPRIIPGSRGKPATDKRKNSVVGRDRHASRRMCLPPEWELSSESPRQDRTFAKPPSFFRLETSGTLSRPGHDRYNRRPFDRATVGTRDVLQGPGLTFTGAAECGSHPLSRIHQGYLARSDNPGSLVTNNPSYLLRTPNHDLPHTTCRTTQTTTHQDHSASRLRPYQTIWHLASAFSFLFFSFLLFSSDKLHFFSPILMM